MKKVKADDYVSNGFFEAARFGNTVVARNNMTSQNDISEKDRAELTAYGKEIVERRTEQFLIQNNRKKIYPNEPCICGSGKKYKRCCGRK